LGVTDALSPESHVPLEEICVKKYVEHPEANQQINLIADLIAKGSSDDAVVASLKAHRMRNLTAADGLWTVDDIRRIRIDFALTPIRREDVEHVLLTTETFSSLPIKKRLEIVSAETAFGMNLFRDFFAGVTDVFGGRSQATQKVLRDARRTVLYELKKEALQVGGNAVIGVDLKYSEFSGQGKSMLFVVATGTAVVM
jgi:uncharacterized protein YbjQ (UPF0145 family)